MGIIDANKQQQQTSNSKPVPPTLNGLLRDGSRESNLLVVVVNGTKLLVVLPCQNNKINVGFHQVSTAVHCLRQSQPGINTIK